jgi:hypothetical protein
MVEKTNYSRPNSAQALPIQVNTGSTEFLGHAFDINEPTQQGDKHERQKTIDDPRSDRVRTGCIGCDECSD